MWFPFSGQEMSENLGIKFMFINPKKKKKKKKHLLYFKINKHIREI
jgi:hypothetical protein